MGPARPAARAWVRSLFLAAVLFTGRVDSGAAGYKLLAEMLGELDAGDFVEIGSDRGEGSTAALAQMAGATGRGFYSVDFSPIGFDRARRACGACAHQGLGEDFLRHTFREVSQHKFIAFAYLDNYDWVWAGEHPESYSLAFPTMIADADMSAYKMQAPPRPRRRAIPRTRRRAAPRPLIPARRQMRREYQDAGLLLENRRSAEAHLAQALLVDRSPPPPRALLHSSSMPPRGVSGRAVTRSPPPLVLIGHAAPLAPY